MLKKFDDFKTGNILNNEREALERELRTRKTRRNNQKYELNINLDLIKNQIIYAIENEQDYVLSIGKREEKLEDSKETVFHIEFENESLGRVRIFKPKDTSDKGHYEINGDYYETSAKDIRDFYHTLNQEIKGQPKILRITESLRDKMVGKSDEDIRKSLENKGGKKFILKDGKKIWVYKKHFSSVNSSFILSVVDEDNKRYFKWRNFDFKDEDIEYLTNWEKKINDPNEKIRN